MKLKCTTNKETKDLSSWAVAHGSGEDNLVRTSKAHRSQGDVNGGLLKIGLTEGHRAASFRAPGNNLWKLLRTNTSLFCCSKWILLVWSYCAFVCAVNTHIWLFVPDEMADFPKCSTAHTDRPEHSSGPGPSSHPGSWFQSSIGEITCWGCRSRLYTPEVRPCPQGSGRKRQNT